MRRSTILAFLFVADIASAAPPDEASRVVVIANAAVPESLELARYYMEARGIPAGNLCELALTRGETVSRGYYESHVRDPLLQFLRERGLAQQVRVSEADARPGHSGWRTVSAEARYVVSMYGVPLRIADSRYFATRVTRAAGFVPDHDGAALDSELAAVLMDAGDLRGRTPNPGYDSIRWDANGDAARLVLLATRLDGPDPATVRRMIDGALDAERRGLHGRAYVDMAAGVVEGGAAGDHWMNEAAERLKREGYECAVDSHGGLWNELYPLADAALYLGWYAEHVEGPFLRRDFAFRPGAIAYHLHSFGAKTLRSADRNWAGPLLARGAGCTIGSVDEPYLGFTPRLQVLVDRLCNGNNWGESAYMSLPVLSWQATVCGDPLYRPFALSLDEQIVRLEASGDPDRVWAYLRRINLLAREGRLNIALAYARDRLRGLDHPLLREKMGDLYAGNDLGEAAGEQYRRALEMAEAPADAARIATKFVFALDTAGERGKADGVVRELMARWPEDPMILALQDLRKR